MPQARQACPSAGRRTPAHQPPRCALRDVSRSGRSMPVVPRHDRGRGGPPSFVPRALSLWAGQRQQRDRTRGHDSRSAYRASIRQTALPHLSIRSGKSKAGAQIYPNDPRPRNARPPDLTGRACWTLGRPTGPAPQRVMGGCSGRVAGALAEPAARTQSIDLCGCRARLRGHLHPHHLTAGGIPALPGSHGTGQAWPSVSRRQPRAGSTDSPASVAVRWAAGR